MLLFPPQFGLVVVTRRKGEVRFEQIAAVGNAEVNVVRLEKRSVVRSEVFMVDMGRL